jgi:hypothetical protein
MESGGRFCFDAFCRNFACCHKDVSALHFKEFYKVCTFVRFAKIMLQ